MPLRERILEAIWGLRRSGTENRVKPAHQRPFVIRISASMPSSRSFLAKTRSMVPCWSSSASSRMALRTARRRSSCPSSRSSSRRCASVGCSLRQRASCSANTPRKSRCSVCSLRLRSTVASSRI